MYFLRYLLRSTVRYRLYHSWYTRDEEATLQKEPAYANATWTPLNYSQYPYGPQGDKYSYNRGARDNAIKMFNSTQLPIKTAIAKEFSASSS